MPLSPPSQLLPRLKASLAHSSGPPASEPAPASLPPGPGERAPPPPPTGILVVLSSIMMAVGRIRAARLLHQVLLHNKMRSPQSFFDTTPSGRILNRFSKDIHVIDMVLGPAILMLLSSFSTCLSTLVIIVISTPLFTVVVLPLAAFYIFVQVLRARWAWLSGGPVLLWVGPGAGFREGRQGDFKAGFG